jgi:5'-3' exonuclease
VASVAGFEADDVIATLACRVSARGDVVVLSGDSDLLWLTAFGSIVARPMKGQELEAFDNAAVCAKYSIADAILLTDYKALVGEKGDNIPGVPGIGPTRAARLLRKYGTIGRIIDAGRMGDCEDSATVARHYPAARLSLELATLRVDAPVPAIARAECRI